MTDGLRAAWAVGVFVLLLGALGALVDFFTVLPGVLVLSLAGGTTAARGRQAGWRWSVAAWAVPLAPLLAVVGVFAWLAHEGADPLAVVVLLVVGVSAVVVTWAGSLVALVVESARLQRRFGEARPAWENGPTPPP